LLQTDPADSAELERLALSWRDEFLEIQTQAEEFQNEKTLSGPRLWTENGRSDGHK
jgi:hypothetical protein